MDIDPGALCYFLHPKCKGKGLAKGVFGKLRLISARIGQWMSFADLDVRNLIMRMQRYKQDVSTYIDDFCENDDPFSGRERRSDRRRTSKHRTALAIPRSKLGRCLKYWSTYWNFCNPAISGENLLRKCLSFWSISSVCVRAHFRITSYLSQ